jgi:hypothetical protein
MRIKIGFLFFVMITISVVDSTGQKIPLVYEIENTGADVNTSIYVTPYSTDLSRWITW